MMKTYFWHTVMIYGNNRIERASFWIILLAIFVLTAWADPV
jgi:hypothetical protein